ncbi:MAG: hypothetical protein ACR2J9_12130 [Gaiellales bacterium]
MLRRVALPLLLALCLLAPAVAAAAKPAAATIGKPAVSWVRLGVVTPAAGETSPLSGRVVVRVLVRHPGIGDAPPGLQTVGTATVVLSRFEGDRNHSIAGGTASHALPVLTEPVGVVYQVMMDRRHSAAVQAAATAGTLRALVLVDQRAKARGRAPARNGNFFQADATLAALPLPLPVAEPPLLTGNGCRVVIAADPQGHAIVQRVEVPIDAGRTLLLTTGGKGANGRVQADGAAGALGGTVTILGADGATLSELPAPAGFTLAISPSGRQRGTLAWPAFDAPGTDPVVAGTALLSPPSTS